MQNGTNYTNSSASTVILKDRCSIEITGVDEVISYDERSVVLVVCGIRTVIEGDMLKVTRLSVGDGTVCAAGKITSIIYEDGGGEKKGLIASILGR